MSRLKKNKNFNLYYTDTDSVIIDAPLPNSMVGNNLGQYKLEHIINRAVFLSPKVYGFITSNGEEIIKVKGLSSDALKNVHIQDLEKLLVEDSSMDFVQSKWYKGVLEGNINVTEVAYSLKSTSNKRLPIYDNNAIFTDTIPYHYNDVEIK